VRNLRGGTVFPPSTLALAPHPHYVFSPFDERTASKPDKIEDEIARSQHLFDILVGKKKRVP
jgi:hypothetical protein